MVFARPLRPVLLRAHPAVRTLFAVTAAFATYFTMYGVRKAFAAAEFAGVEVSFFGSTFGLKTLLVVSQIVGYATAKFGGVKFCSEARRQQRGWLLIAMIAWAEAALVLFAVVPPPWKPVALFLNGMPLGMVWGLVVQYLEGRRT